MGFDRLKEEPLHHDQHRADRPAGPVIDPVCGMTVEPDEARSQGLHSSYQNVDYYFCARGCKLDFDEDPSRYLDPSHTPSM